VIGAVGSVPVNKSSATSSNECSARSDVSGYPRNSTPSSPSLVIADAICTSIVGRGAWSLRRPDARTESSSSTANSDVRPSAARTRDTRPRLTYA